MRQFSIRTLMAVIVGSVVGLAALRNANELWAGITLLGAVAAVCFALMGAVMLRGTERVWCGGFVFLGGIYLACAFVPWLSGEFQPIPGTTQILRGLFPYLSPPTTGGTTTQNNVARLERQTRRASFNRVGHSLFALFAGLAGGTGAVWFYRRRKRAELAGGETQA
jgi:hypothetical protein